MDSHHIVPNSDRGGWDIRRNDSSRSSGHFERKQDAINTGRQISRNQKTELFIHGKDGKIQSRDSHGHDPYPPKG